jgi:hypothetical protein
MSSSVNNLEKKETIQKNKEISTLDNKSSSKKKRKKNLNKRCNFLGCKKKLLISNLSCSCNKRFCSEHRIKTSHNCSTLNKEVNVDDFKQKNGLGGGEIEKLIKI